MTNTSMTFEEWLVQEIADHHENNDKDMIKHLNANVYLMQKAYQDSQAQQSSVIADLKEDLLDLRKQVNYRCADVQRLTELNIELVEALEAIISLEHIPTNFGVARTIARSAIAKVKGK